VLTTWNRISLLVKALLGAALMAFGATNAQAQCSTAAWSSTTGAAQPLGVSTAPVGKKYEGHCGLTVDAAAAPGYVTTTEPSAEGILTARFYLLASDLAINSGDTIIFQARDGGTVQVELRLRKGNDGTTRLVARALTGGTLTGFLSTPLQETWQAVNVAWTAGAGNGSFALKLDGVVKVDVTNLDNGGMVVNEVDLGIINDPAATGKVVFDAFDSRRTLIEPPLLAINELFSLSTRADVGNSTASVIAGFIISGDTKKCVVLRSRGQSVNVPVTRLEDPTLTLKSGNTTLDENDNWQDHPTANLLQSLGVQPAEPLDAAFHICLDPGPYTVLLRGSPGTVRGVGIVEVIDVDKGTPFLGSISTRALVKTGIRRVVAGFIIEGNQSKTVLIRGRGPTVNVAATLLADPIIELRSGSSVLAQNDNWGQAANAAEISATGKAPADPNESAILITLQPGSYTVFLGPADGAQGVGIIEVIDESGGSIELN
jgi:hypothetical protein